MRTIVAAVILDTFALSMGAMVVDEDPLLDLPPVFLPESVVRTIREISDRDARVLDVVLYPRSGPDDSSVIHTPLGRFREVETLGRGASGNTVLASCVDPHSCGTEEVAVKFVESRKDPHPLVREFAILQFLPPRLSVVPVYVSPATEMPNGQWKRYLVTSRAGISVEAYGDGQPGGHITLLQLMHYFSKTIRLIEQLHATGLVHCDAHSGNVLFAHSDSHPDITTSSLILIDFEETQLPGRSCTRASDLSWVIRLAQDECPTLNGLLPSERLDADRTIEPHGLSPASEIGFREALVGMYAAMDAIDYTPAVPSYQSIIDHIESAILILS